MAVAVDEDSQVKALSKTSRYATVQIHPAAPDKPSLGDRCNGCGLCCAAEPCPVSRVLLGHRTGSCPALLWKPLDRRYMCGMVVAPTDFLAWLPARWSEFFGRRFNRWIAAGMGCDFDAEPE